MKTCLDDLNLNLFILELQNGQYTVDIRLTPKTFKTKNSKIFNCSICNIDELNNCIATTTLETANIILKHLELDNIQLSKQRELFLKSGLFLPEYDKEAKVWFYIDNLGTKQYE